MKGATAEVDDERGHHLFDPKGRQATEPTRMQLRFAELASATRLLLETGAGRKTTVVSRNRTESCLFLSVEAILNL